MKVRIVCLIWLIAQGVLAQDFSAILSAIEHSSTMLSALKSQADARKMENRVGLTPPNPEVEFGYLWGTPSGIGSRKDINISQQFDFPTVYSRQKKLADVQDDSVEYEYKSQRMELLLEARQMCIEVVRCNALLMLYEKQMTYLQRVRDAYMKLFESNDVSRADVNRAQLALLEAENACNSVKMEKTQLIGRLMQMTGGQAVAIDDKEFVVTPLPVDFDSFCNEAAAEHPAMRYLMSVVEVNVQQQKVISAAAMPRFSLGYMGEFVQGESYQGVTVGMSIPLWEHRNRSRSASLSTLNAEVALSDAKVRYVSELQLMYVQAKTLAENVAKYDEMLEKCSTEEWLYDQLISGETSIASYADEVKVLSEVKAKRVLAERDLMLILSAMNAYKL